MASRRSPASLDSSQRSDPGAARAAAVASLARRDYARGELHSKLRARGFEEGTLGPVLEDLVREGALDDGRFAHNYVAHHAARGQGPVRIAMLLGGLGLAAPVIEAALAQGPDWPALARKVRTARFGARPPSDWAETARQARFLQYRGFSSDHIRSATGADPDTGPDQP